MFYLGKSQKSQGAISGEWEPGEPTECHAWPGNLVFFLEDGRNLGLDTSCLFLQANSVTTYGLSCDCFLQDPFQSMIHATVRRYILTAS
jgi:hypothetical protein